ncbi:hypothetical protein [Nocardioides pacificus]
MIEPFGWHDRRHVPRAAGDGGATGLAVVAPGRRYSPARPMLDLARVGFLQHGYVVRELWWDAKERLADPSGWVREHVCAEVEAEAELADGAGPAGGRLVVCGKSLGTRASTLALHPGPASRLDGVWLTPLLTNPGVVEGMRAISAAGGRQLLVGGLADELWDSAVAHDLAALPGCTMLEFADADHSLGVPGDVVRTGEVLLEVARALRGFLAAPPGSSY